MFMEAYGSVGNWADSIIKQAASTIIGEKVAKETLSNGQGVSPSTSVNNEVASPKASDQVVNKMNEVSQQKAMDSLRSKIESLEGQRIHLEELVGQRDKELGDLKSKVEKAKNMSPIMRGVLG